MTGQQKDAKVYYAAVKWSRDASRDDIDRALQTDLPILALSLIEEHGFTFERVRQLFEDAVQAAEWDYA